MLGTLIANLPPSQPSPLTMTLMLFPQRRAFIWHHGALACSRTVSLVREMGDLVQKCGYLRTGDASPFPATI